MTSERRIELRLDLWLIWIYVSLTGVATLLIHLPPVLSSRGLVVTSVVTTTGVGLYLALRALFLRSFSLLLLGLTVPASVALLAFLTALQADSLIVAMMGVAITYSSFIIVLVWGAAETASLINTESKLNQSNARHLTRFRLRDLLIVMSLAAVGAAFYRLLAHQPFDFWLIIYAQSVFTCSAALITAFLVRELSMQ